MGRTMPKPKGRIFALTARVGGNQSGLSLLAHDLHLRFVALDTIFIVNLKIIRMEFWKNVGGSLPDWVATVAFLGLTLLMFITFVTTDNSSPVFKVLILAAVGTGAYLYWGRY